MKIRPQKGRLIRIKYISATDTKGVRICLKDTYGEKRIILDYNYDIEDILEQGLKHLKITGAYILAYGETSTEFFAVVHLDYDLIKGE